ncbi:MAG: hypothetical protein DMG77_01940 [Acidobacteria bacterium]|nr:MAG: hypothetical protein DMG77_01940 [Acidobacteriota bacterium]
MPQFWVHSTLWDTGPLLLLSLPRAYAPGLFMCRPYGAGLGWGGLCLFPQGQLRPGVVASRLTGLGAGSECAKNAQGWPTRDTMWPPRAEARLLFLSGLYGAAEAAPLQSSIFGQYA